MTNRSHYLFYSLILAVVGAVFLLQVASVTVRVIRTQLLFREVIARVVATSVTEIEQAGGGEFASMEAAFVPTIKYEYEIDGKRYSSVRYWVADIGADRAWADRVAASFAVGNEIRIFYDPASPEYSVVTKEVPKITNERIAIGVGGSFICFLSAGIYLWRCRQPQGQVLEAGSQHD